MLTEPLTVRQSGSSHFPCPSGNNTQIGDTQKFNVFCGVDTGGVEIDRQQVDSMTTCVNLCTSHQSPRCDGVTLRADNTCIFKTSVGGNNTLVSGADSASGVLPNPGPTSRCASLGTGMIQLVTAKNFNLQCSQVYNGNDLQQVFQPSFDDCLSTCASTTGCGGVSFDVQQSQGFNNCYMKTSVTTGGLLTKQGVDSAFLAVDNNASLSTASGSSSSSKTTTAPAPASTVNQVSTKTLEASISTVTQMSTTTLGGSTSTVVQMSTTTLNPATSIVVQMSTTTLDGSTSTVLEMSTITTTQPASTPSDQAITGNPVASAPTGAAAASSSALISPPAGGTSTTGQPSALLTIPAEAQRAAASNAWVAAPIIGSLAAVALLLGAYALWARRRRNQGKSIGILTALRRGRSSRRRRRGSVMLSGNESTFGEKLADEEAAPPSTARTRSVESSRNLGTAMSAGGSAVGTNNGGSRGNDGVLITHAISTDRKIPTHSRPHTAESKISDMGDLDKALDDIVLSKNTAGLRDSQNGLRLNGVSIPSTAEESAPGIPKGFAGPRSPDRKSK